MLTIAMVGQVPVSVMGQFLTLTNPSFLIERAALTSAMYKGQFQSETYFDIQGLLSNGLITIFGDGLNISTVAQFSQIIDFVTAPVVPVPDLLIGPSTSSSQVVTALAVGSSVSVLVDTVATVTKVGVGGSEFLTDSYSTQFRATLKNVSGTVAVITSREGVPWVDYDNSMRDVGINIAGSGSNVVVQYSNGALVGTGAQVTYAINVTLLSQVGAA
jgi:hypothetical protein